ncbi:hypothetical protein [Orenia marismortui]|uniref:hypothetical protein n=1 Tax=Orenia marismortui TaxID=46469 RepID=UPI0003819C40|nr:hypothetical protein [Orenia marismortui]
MAEETSKIKGTRLSGELLEFVESQNNSSETIRDSIRCFKVINEELDGNYEYHISRALKLYKQYLSKIENLEINIVSNNTLDDSNATKIINNKSIKEAAKDTTKDIKEEVKKDNQDNNSIGIDGQDISLEELDNNLDNF